jgi:hypothetical protein
MPAAGRALCVPGRERSARGGHESAPGLDKRNWGGKGGKGTLPSRAVLRVSGHKLRAEHQNCPCGKHSSGLRPNRQHGCGRAESVQELAHSQRQRHCAQAAYR